MKIGRNDPCSCGSGKKFKKCCLNNPTMILNNPKNYFSIKGKNAEECVHNIAKETFFEDWCYLNPKLHNDKEMCDLLVIFNDIAIIWQVKDIKLNTQGKYKESEVKKNLRQLTGARRQLTNTRITIELDNPRRGKEKFDPATIKHIFLVSVLMGEGEAFSTFFQKYKNFSIHTFTREFLEIVLNELDTIGDFVEYLYKKEAFLAKDQSLLITEGGEEELLACYRE